MSQRSLSPRMRSPRESYRRSASPRSPRGRERSFSPHSSVSSYYDRSLSRSRSRSRSFSRQQPHRPMSRSPYRSSSRHRYRRYYSRSPSPRHRYRRSPPPPPPHHRRYRSRSPPPPRRINRNINRDCRVYVGNLSFDAKWHHLKDFMRQAGEVVYADVLFLANGRSKGCGIVEYRYPEDAKRAIHTLHKVDFMGRPVFVREDRDYDAPQTPLPPPPPKDKYEVPDGYRLFVRNLPYSASWQDMKDLFRKAGRVLHTDVNTDPGSRRSNGTGTVIFSDSRVAHTAIDMFNGYDWHGNRLEVGEEHTILPKTSSVNPSATSSSTSASASATTSTSVPPPSTSESSAPPLPPSSTTAVSPTPPPTTATTTAAAAASTTSAYHNEPKETETLPPPPPPSSNRPVENAYTNPEPIQYHQQHQQQQPIPPVVKPEYNTGYENMYQYRNDIAPPIMSHASMYNMSLVGGPGAHLPSQGQNQIFVNNLPFSTTWQDLIDLFRHVGPVVRSEILTMNGHPKGAGFVRFEDAAVCEKAIEKFNGYLYGGRHLDIRMDNKR